MHPGPDEEPRRTPFSGFHPFLSLFREGNPGFDNSLLELMNFSHLLGLDHVRGTRKVCLLFVDPSTQDWSISTRVQLFYHH